MLLKTAKGLLSMTSFTPFLSSKTDAPKLSPMIIQNNNKKNVGWKPKFLLQFFIVCESTKRLEAVNGVRKFVILDYLRMLVVEAV